MDKIHALHPALLPLIDALAQQMVADYLTQQAAANQTVTGERTNPVPLPAVGKAA